MIKNKKKPENSGFDLFFGSEILIVKLDTFSDNSHCVFFSKKVLHFYFFIFQFFL